MYPRYSSTNLAGTAVSGRIGHPCKKEQAPCLPSHGHIFFLLLLFLSITNAPRIANKTCIARWGNEKKAVKRVLNTSPDSSSYVFAFPLKSLLDANDPRYNMVPSRNVLCRSRLQLWHCTRSIDASKCLQLQLHNTPIHLAKRTYI